MTPTQLTEIFILHEYRILFINEIHWPELSLFSFFNKCEIYNWKSENKPCFQSQCNFRKFTDFLFTYNLWIFGPQNAHKQLICDKEHMIIEFYRFYECRSHQVAL